MPDFPKPGIQFKDITPLLSNPSAWAEIIDQMESLANEVRPNLIAGIEARGFLIGASLATKLGMGFIPVRKKGKLPGKTIGIDYELEYGHDRLEICSNESLNKKSKILIVDDLLATGGTALATQRLIEKSTATVVGFQFIIELCSLKGRIKLPQSVPIHSLIKYN